VRRALRADALYASAHSPRRSARQRLGYCGRAGLSLALTLSLSAGIHAHGLRNVRTDHGMVLGLRWTPAASAQSPTGKKEKAEEAELEGEAERKGTLRPRAAYGAEQTMIGAATSRRIDSGPSTAPGARAGRRRRGDLLGAAIGRRYCYALLKVQTTGLVTRFRDHGLRSRSCWRLAGLPELVSRADWSGQSVMETPR